MTSGRPSGEQRTPIRVGVAVPDGHAEGASTTRGHLDLFCEALGDALGGPVLPYGLAHYRDLLEAMHDGSLDVAWLPPIIALRATARGRTLPIAIPLRGGAASFSSALFTRPGAAFKRPADLVAVRAAWVDRQSAAGYLVIRASLRAQGFDLERAFASESFLGSHEAVVQAVLHGEADVGATFVYLDATRGSILRAGWGTAAPQVIAYGGPIPSDVIAASIRVPVTTLRAIQRALCDESDASLKLAAAKLLGADGFVVPLPEHLDPLSRLLGYLEDLHNQSAFPPPIR